MSSQETDESYDEEQDSDNDQSENYPKKGDILKDRYLMIKKLGSGSFCEVWLCWDQTDKQFSALKIVESDYSDVGSDEIKILDGIHNADQDDPYRNRIVKLLDSFEVIRSNGLHICLVFPVYGSNLLELKQQSPSGKIPLAEVKTIIRQVFQGLDYLHSKGQIIHTDIKVENVMTCVDETYPKKLAYEEVQEWSVPAQMRPEELNEILSNSLVVENVSNVHSVKKNFDSESSSEEVAETGPSATTKADIEVVIGDFGHASWVHDKSSFIIQQGAYRSPEILLEAGYDTPLDIWSTACLAFELATGDCLFDPQSGTYYSRDEHHLALIIERLGGIPKDIALSGEYSGKFFNEDGQLKHIKELRPIGLYEILTEHYDIPESEGSDFTSFLGFLLNVDPKLRPSAAEALKHHWLQE